MFSQTKPEFTCNICGKGYQKQHRCLGRGHRRRNPLSSSRSNKKARRTAYKSGNGRSSTHFSRGPAQNGKGSQDSSAVILVDQPLYEEIPGVKIFMNKYFAHLGISTPSRPDVVRSLLAASSSRYWRPSGRERILDLAERLARDVSLLRLQAEIVYQQSILLRLKGDVKASEQSIETFLSSLREGCHEVAPGDLAALYLSQASNRAYEFKFGEAHTELKKWKPVQSMSARQGHLLWDHILCAGRLMRGEGYFKEAKICFETCLRTVGLRDSKRYVVEAALADVYCELDYVESKQRPCYLSQATVMLDPEINRLRLSSKQHLKGFRRLLLSLIEVNIRQGFYYDAGLRIRELLALYAGVHEPDIVDRLGHVRALIAFARIAPTVEDALKRWQDVLAWNKIYNPLEEEVFTCGVVYLFLCITWYSFGNINECLRNFQNARKVFEKKERQYLIPGIGTYLYFDVCNQISAVGLSLGAEKRAEAMQ